MRIRHLAVAIAAVALTSVVLAGPAMKGNLHGTNGAQGFVKLKYDKADALQLFEVQIRKVPAGTYYVFALDVSQEPDAWVEIGSIAIAEDQGAGKLKVNARRGDANPFLFDPKGADLEVRDSNDPVTYEVILDGKIPTAKIKGPK
jgi:hypothetical protein